MRNAKQSVETAGLVAGFGAAGAVAGAAAGNIAGTDVHYMEGVDANIRLSLHSGLDVHTMLTTIQSPDFKVGAGPVDLGVQGTVNNLNPPFLHGGASEHIISLLSQFDNAVVGQTEAQIREHLITNAKYGAVIGAAACYGGLRLLRAWRQKRNGNYQDLQSLREKAAASTVDIQPEIDNLEARLGLAERPKTILGRRLKLGLIAAVPLVAATTAFGATKLSIPETIDGAPHEVNLPGCFIKKEPRLKDVTVTGSNGEAIKLMLYASCKYPEEVRSVLRADGKNFSPAFAKYKARRPWWFDNSGNIARIVQLSDQHCNKADDRYLLRDELKAADPDVIINTGDTQTNSGHMPIYEDACIPDFVKAVEYAAKANHKTIKVVGALGNHDAKKITKIDSRWVTYRTLSSKHPMETVKLGEVGFNESEINFVSIEDPEDVVWSPPPETVETDTKLLAQAKKIAAIACKVKTKTGVAPWVIAHREQALSAAIADDCASVALSGHTHEDGGVKEVVGPHGNDVLQHTAGSVSGADMGVTIYQKPQLDASFTEFFYDKSKEEIVSYVSPAIHVDGSVSMLHGNAPFFTTPWQEESRIAPFIQELQK
jgi:predicted MPP superfamily phosphohydrolase